jgi:RimJ/RimL family protein N-acetyltransferase
MAVTGGDASPVVQGERLHLRDRRAEDLEDYVRWFPPGQEWQKWDAPWESVDEFTIDARRRWVERLNRPLPVPRRRLEIVTAVGRHIGWVNSYWVDKASCWRDDLSICDRSPFWRWSGDLTG